MPAHIRIVALFALAPLTAFAADPLPEKALIRLGTIRFHSRQVHGLAFSPNGSILATGSSDSTVRFWNSTTGRQTQCWERNQTEVNALAFAPDGKTFATAETGTLRLRDTATGRDLNEWDLLPLDWTKCLQFSADGKLLAVQVQANPLFVRSVMDGKEIPPPGAPFPKPNLVACSDGLRHFAGLDDDNTLHVWESKTGRVLGKLRKFPGNRITALSASGRFIAIGGEFANHAIRLWDVVSGKELPACAGHGEFLSELTFSPDERSLASTGAWDRSIRVWDVSTGKQRWAFKGQVAGFSSGVVRFAPDGKSLAFVGGDGIPSLLDVATGRETINKGGHAGWITHTAFLGEDSRVATAGTDRTILIWEGATGKELHRLPRPSEVQALTSSPDGKSLFVVEDRILRMVDATTGKEVRKFNSDEEPVHALGVFPTGTLLATGGATAEDLQLWDVKTATKLRKLEGAMEPVSVLCFSKDGQLLAAGCGDRTIRVWNVESGAQISNLSGPAEPLFIMGFHALAFAPDGRSLASVWRDGSYTIFELATGEPRRLVRLKDDFHALAWAPDGRLIAHAGTRGVVSLCDPFSGSEVVRLSGHENKVTSLEFSADGRRLLSGSHDTSALIWKVPAPAAAVATLKPRDARMLIKEMDRQATPQAFIQMGRLVSTPGLSGILREYLPAATKEDGKRIAEFIRDLDSKNFKVRERAAAELTKYGERAWRPLRRALEGGPTLEMRRRVERLLEPEKVVPCPVVVRRQRLLELLELCGDAEAIRVLEELSAGDPEAELTREAREGLARLKRRPR